MTTFYESVLRSIPKEKRGGADWEALTNAVVVNVDAVARLYYEESPQVVWDLADDFPNVAPPWPAAFYEFRMPDRMNMNGRVEAHDGLRGREGLLVIGAAAPEEMDLTLAAKEAAWMLATSGAAKQLGYLRAQAMFKGATRDAVWDMLGDDRRASFLAMVDSQDARDARQSVGWGVQCILWVAADGYAPVEIGRYAMPVRRDGRIPHLNDGSTEGKVPVSFSITASRGMTDERAQGLIGEVYAFLHVPLLAVSLSHCRNVEVVTVEERELTPRHAREVGIPKVTVKTLEITPMRRVLDGEGGMGEHGDVKRALHICRGHFKDYRERGLFGRNRGIYWWDMAVRGRAERGVVLKDYAVASR